MTVSSVDELIAVIGEGEMLGETEAELVRTLFAGGVADLGEGEVRAIVIRRLCLRANRFRGGQVGQFRIKGGKVVDDLDLSGLKLDFGLRFEDVELKCLILHDTRVLAIDLLGGKATGIEANRLEVEHDFVVSNEFECNGSVRMLSAHIDGDLNCGGARFIAPRGRASLMLDGVHIGSRLFIGNGFHANHGVFARNSRIEGGVLGSYGRFDREVDFTRAQVQSDFRLLGAEIGRANDEEQSSDIELRLKGISVKGELSLERTKFRGSSIVLEQARVDGTLRWSVVRPEDAAGTFRVNLEQARVGYMDDDLDRWHGAQVQLDGFSYGGVSIEGKDWLKERKKWLESQPDDRWSFHPYGKMRVVLADSGREDWAREIAIERERIRTSKGGFSRLGKVNHRLYGLLLGYGYKPFRFFLISAAIVLLFWLPFSTLEACTPNRQLVHCEDFAFPGKGTTPYTPPLFSLDAFIPVDLGQVAAWRPSEPGFAYLVAAETAVGWLFTGLLLGAVTGVLRRD